MRILWLLFVLHTALAQPGFGRSYLRNSRLCHKWSCINTKLGLPDSLPPSESFNITLRGLLPPTWHGVVDEVIRTCYLDRPRRYTNTCPGQALLQCTVDQLVNNCPEECWRKVDACAPVESLAGVNYMFSQSRYQDLEKNILLERRPAWFLRNYFNTKCCNLPPLVSSAALTECGFTNMIEYANHSPQLQSKHISQSQNRDSPVFVHYSPEPEDNKNSLQVVNLSDTLPRASTIQARSLNAAASNNGESLQVASFQDISSEASVIEVINPLDCCDISEFIEPAWRSECGFELGWNEQSRLTVKDSVEPITTTPATKTVVTHRDLIVIPHSCEKETCVFDKLNITFGGTVNVEAFKKLLDNLTDIRPEWSKAKARVVTTCLTKPIKDYEADCEINKVLACTFDLLSENCPISESAAKHDICKHSNNETFLCQINTSKTRPKNRRSACILPELVEFRVLSECGLNSLKRVEQVVQKTTKKRNFSWQNTCKDLTPSTSCVLSKMGVLNKYGFIDYFNFKEKIRRFADNAEWSHINELYSLTSLYREHCNSAKQLLNIVDSMLMTCPISKRKSSQACVNTFNTMKNSPISRNQSKEHIDQDLNHFHHVFFPSQHPTQITTLVPIKTTKIVKKPIYDYGILSSSYVPKVELLDVKPKIVKKPLILLPVYLRPNLAYRPYLRDGMLRSSLYIQNQTAHAHVNYLNNGSALPVPVSTNTN